MGGYGAYQNFAHIFAQDFAGQTSTKIANEIDFRLSRNPANVLHIKKMWAVAQLTEMAEVNGWNIADTALIVAGLADPTGEYGVVLSFRQLSNLDLTYSFS